MTEQVKRARGRPRKPVSEVKAALVEAKEMHKVAEKTITTIGEHMDKKSFIVVNTSQVKGVRINLAKITTYAPNGDLSIQVARDNGNNTSLIFGSKEDMLHCLARLDAYCLAETI